ncbi:MAG: IS66 family insertion sequence element accessory protein TnpB [Lachnospiraceae bacterium]|nr:IS66 family insertion sequence element accessory protein TnpB [Lachnospiraceae bacterium]
MDQSTHNVRRANWLNIVNQCQERPSDVSARQWLADNGIKEKAYYYWLRKFRKEAYGQMQVSASAQSAEVSFAEFSIPMDSPYKPMPCSLHSDPVAVIKCGNISIEISNDISEEVLSRLLQEAAHA